MVTTTGMPPPRERWNEGVVVSGFFSWIADSGVVQGVIIGATFAFLTTVLLLDAVARSKTTTVNGWSTIRAVGQPGNGVLVRAAMQKALPVVNSFEEAAYWTADRDDTGRRLTGDRSYLLRFPAGQLPPNEAFWSLTATDTVGYQTGTASGRSSIDSRSALATNADGSVDIELSAHPSSGVEGNRVATPSGRFKLTLRAYLPGAAIVTGDYTVPPVVEVRS